MFAGLVVSSIPDIWKHLGKLIEALDSDLYLQSEHKTNGKWGGVIFNSNLSYFLLHLVELYLDKLMSRKIWKT